MIGQRFHRDGDFNACPGDPTPARGGSYRNGWLAWGAHLLGAYHLSEPALDRLEKSLHPDFGGVPDVFGADEKSREYDAGSAARPINALLACGRPAAALRAGAFLKSLYDRQAAGSGRVLLRADADGALIDPRARGMTEGVEVYGFEVAKPAQTYWFLGYSLRVLARLHRVTRDPAWLETAERIRGWLGRSHSDLYCHITNGKVAWGSAEMYAETGLPAWADLSQRIARWVTEQQGEDGIWVRRTQYASAEQQPLPVSIDTSIERMFYMIDIPRALAARDAQP